MRRFIIPTLSGLILTVGVTVLLGTALVITWYMGPVGSIILATASEDTRTIILDGVAVAVLALPGVASKVVAALCADRKPASKC